MSDHRPHIVLLGGPGSGTSTIGRALARETQRSFFDVDDAPIPGSEAQASGEPGPSPEAEREAHVHWLRTVLATSGPAVVSVPWYVIDVLEQATTEHTDARNTATRSPIIVVLDAPADVRQRRTNRSRPTAGLARSEADVDDSLARSVELAHLVIDTAAGTPADATATIVERLSIAPAR